MNRRLSDVAELESSLSVSESARRDSYVARLVFHFFVTAVTLSVTPEARSLIAFTLI